MSLTDGQIEFCQFTFDFSERVLRQNNAEVNLPPRSLEVLEFFLRNPNRTVTKTELKMAVWGTVHVEDNTVEFQVSTVRRAIAGSDGEGPRLKAKYKQGWQLLAVIKPVMSQGTAMGLPETVEPSMPTDESVRTGLRGNSDLVGSAASTLVPRRRRSGFASRAIKVSAISVGLIALFYAISTQRPGTPTVEKFVLLSSDERPKVGPLLTDGRRIYFRERVDGNSQVVSVPFAGGVPVALAGIEPGAILEDISPDGRLLVQSHDAAGNDYFAEFDPMHKVLRRLSSRAGGDAVWGPNGQSLIASSGNQLLQFDLADQSWRKQIELQGHVDSPVLARNGKRIKFALQEPKIDKTSLWELKLGEKEASRLSWISNAHDWVQRPTSSKNGYFFYEAGDHLRQDIWVAPDAFPNMTPRKGSPMTHGPGSWNWPAMTPDPSTILALQTQVRGELVAFDPKSSSWHAIWNGLSVYELNYSPDGRRLAFTFQPDHTIWTSQIDGSRRVQLSNESVEAHQPHWSPDGRTVAFMGKKANGKYKIFVVPGNGGRAQEVTKDTEDEGVPTWSSDGGYLLYGELRGQNPSSRMLLHTIDLKTGHKTELTNSQGLWSPRWSPGGRYILAVTANSRVIYLSDFHGSSWSRVVSMANVDNVQWSSDSQYIYFDGQKETGGLVSIFRIRLSDRNLEELAQLTDFVVPPENWYGVAPDGTLLAFSGHQVTEVYALKCRLP